MKLSDDEWELIENVLLYGETHPRRSYYRTNDQQRLDLANRIRCRGIAPTPR